MRAALRFTPSRPKSSRRVKPALSNSEREKTSLSGRLPAISVVYSAPEWNVSRLAKCMQLCRAALSGFVVVSSPTNPLINQDAVWPVFMTGQTR